MIGIPLRETLRVVSVGSAATTVAGEEIVSAALEKVDKKDLVREELANDSSLAEAWARHRVL